MAVITGASYEISLDNDQTDLPDLVDIFNKNFTTDFNFNVESDCYIYNKTTNRLV